MVRATIRPPALRARSLGIELARYALGDGGVDGEDVPVERAAGGGAHLHEEVDLVVGELVEAARDDRLDLGALVLADGPGQREQLLGRGVPGGDGLRRRRRSGWRTGWWTAPRPRRPWPRGRAAASRPAARAWAARRPRPAPMTCRRSAQCPTMKPALTAIRPSRASRYSPKVCQFQGDALLQGDQGHALDLGHHPAGVVGVLGPVGVERARG